MEAKLFSVQADHKQIRSYLIMISCERRFGTTVSSRNLCYELWRSNMIQITILRKQLRSFLFPDGKRIIFSSNLNIETGRNFDLYIINIDGTVLNKSLTLNPSMVFNVHPRQEKTCFASTDLIRATKQIFYCRVGWITNINKIEMKNKYLVLIVVSVFVWLRIQAQTSAEITSEDILQH
jgi:hypothetical protein